MTDYGHFGYHLIYFNKTDGDFGDGAIATTDLGTGLSVNGTSSVTILDGGNYSSNTTSDYVVEINDPKGYGSATATVTGLSADGDGYKITQITLANASTGHFAPDIRVYLPNGTTTREAKIYINSTGLPKPLAFYNTINCQYNVAVLTKLKMVNNDGDTISTLVDCDDSADGLGENGAGGGDDGVPLYIESGNSITGLFRGDQIEFGDPATVYGTNLEVPTDADYQVALFISAKGRVGGRWV
jgi:hypothetical protein